MIVLWVGAVYERDIASFAWPPKTTIVVVPRPNDSFSAFSALADRYQKQYGSMLKGILEEHGLPYDTKEPIVLAGFSAGYLMMEPILASADASRILAVEAADSNWEPLGSDLTNKTSKPGYRAFAARAARGETLMWITSGINPGPDGQTMSGFSSTRVLLSPFTLADIPCVSLPPAVCSAAKGVGELRWYIFKDPPGGRPHQQQATVIAPQLVPMIVQAAYEKFVKPKAAISKDAYGATSEDAFGPAAFAPDLNPPESETSPVLLWGLALAGAGLIGYAIYRNTSR
jgi:hypothetical protein